MPWCKKALHYLNLAAEQGSAEAQFHLGALHIRGIALARDYTKAFYNFNLAAHQVGRRSLTQVDRRSTPG